MVHSAHSSCPCLPYTLYQTCLFDWSCRIHRLLESIKNLLNKNNDEMHHDRDDSLLLSGVSLFYRSIYKILKGFKKGKIAT